MRAHYLRNTGWAALLLVLLCSFQIAVSRFTAVYQGTDMKLEWELPSEDGIVQYELARKRPDESNYVRIALLAPSGMGSYTYLDQTLYKDLQTQGSPTTLSYRLLIKTQSGTQSHFVNVTNAPTAVQRSWGSIKSMFR